MDDAPALLIYFYEKKVNQFMLNATAAFMA